jgi:tetratricopeptide (TPR) repeat protein
MTRSRYPGTRPFGDSPEDSALFFGRTREGEQLHLRVLSVPLVVQFAKSGLGKTSLLQAWLFPRLRQKPFLPAMVRLNVPGETLARAVARSMGEACRAEGLPFPEAPADSLAELLSSTTVWRDDLLLTPVLVFDQFEEIFTLRDAAFREDLARELGALAAGTASARPMLKIVLSLREDYLGSLQELSGAIPGLFHERLRLEPLDEAAAREAITAPAQLVAGTAESPYSSPAFDFEPAALESMIDYLKGSSGIIEPFQLQLLCRHAEEIASGKRNPSGAPVTLTVADFQGARGFASVLENFYRDTLLKLPRSQRKRAQALCERGLLDVTGHRLMLEQGQIRRAFGLEAGALATLAEQRLVHRERRLESVFYEISHDRLAESIFASRPFRLPPAVKRAFWASALAAALVVGGLLWWHDVVQTEREKAEGMVSFLLGDFLEEVRDIGRSTMLEEVQEHLDQRVGAVDDWVDLNRGLALRNRGDLKRTRGSVAEAAVLFGQALEAFQVDLDDRASRREAARTHGRLGEALADQGQLTQASSQYEAAVAAWRQVVGGGEAADPDDCTGLAESLLTAGDLRARMGEGTLAHAHLTEALGIVSDLLFGPAKGDRGCGFASGKVEPYPDPRTLEVFGEAASLRARLFGYRDDYEGAAALTLEAKRLRPPSISIRKNALVALASRGRGRAAEDPQNALEDYRTVLADFEELRRWDPANRLWQREWAATQLLMSEGILACHANKAKNCQQMPALEEAEVMSLEAMATLRALAGLDPGDLSLPRDLAWALQDHAHVLAARGRHVERLASLEEAERIYGGAASAKAAEGVEELGLLLGEKSDALSALGRTSEAQASLQVSTKLLEGLLESHPDGVSYLWELSAARQRHAALLRKGGDRAGAEAADREAKQLDARYQALMNQGVDEAAKLRALHTTRVNEGATLSAAGDHAAALGKFKEAEAAARERVRLQPSAFGGYADLRNVYDWIQLMESELHRDEKRAAALNAGMQAAQVAALLAPEESTVAAGADLAKLRVTFGRFLYDGGRLEEALAIVQAQVVVGEDVGVPGAWQDARHLWSLGNAKCGLGMVSRDLKRAGWEEAVRSGLIHIQRAAEIDKRNPEYPKEVGSWRKYLADQLEADGRPERAAPEYRLALDAYRRAIGIAPADQDAREAIRQLTERGVR